MRTCMSLSFLLQTVVFIIHIFSSSAASMFNKVSVSVITHNLCGLMLL